MEGSRSRKSSSDAERSHKNLSAKVIPWQLGPDMDVDLHVRPSLVIPPLVAIPKLLTRISHHIIHYFTFVLAFLLPPSFVSAWPRFLPPLAFSCATLTAVLSLSSNSLSARYNNR